MSTFNYLAVRFNKVAKILSDLESVNAARAEQGRKFDAMRYSDDPQVWCAEYEVNRGLSSKFKSVVKKLMKELGVECIYTSWGEKVKQGDVCYAWVLGVKDLFSIYGTAHNDLSSENRTLLEHVFELCGRPEIEVY